MASLVGPWLPHALHDVPAESREGQDSRAGELLESTCWAFWGWQLGGGGSNRPGDIGSSLLSLWFYAGTSKFLNRGLFWTNLLKLSVFRAQGQGGRD